MDRNALNELLRRHGIAPLDAGGTYAEAASHGGQIATIVIEPKGEEIVEGLVVRGERAEGTYPLDEARARAMIASLGVLLPRDASFEHMLSHLLLAAGRVYADSGAQTLIFEPVHLHASSYHVGDARLTGPNVEEGKPRLASDAHDRHAVFSHRRGEDPRFPG